MKRIAARLVAPFCAVLMLLAPALRAQEDADAKARAGLLASLAAGKTKDVEKALKLREGALHDLVLPLVAGDAAALADAQKLAAAFPPPEKLGLTKLLTDLASSTPDARQAFAAAYGAVRGLERRAEEAQWPAEDRKAELTEAARRATVAASPYLSARVLLVECQTDLGGDFRARRKPIDDAKTALEAAGDRRREAYAAALAALPLLASFEGEAAIRARAGAQELLVDSGAPHDRGPLAAAFGRLDLVLGEHLLDDGRADAALAAASRARTLLKQTTPLDALRLNLLAADAKMEAAGPAAAAEQIKPLIGLVPVTDDPRLLVDGARVVSRVLRRTGKGDEAARLLALCRGRLKALAGSPADESVLNYLSGLALGSAGKDEPATAAFVAAEDAAKKAGDAYLHRAARAGRAIMLIARKEESNGRKMLEEALGISAGGPTLDRISAAAYKLAFAEWYVDMKRGPEARPWLSDATAVCDELGCSYEGLPGRADSVRNESEEPLRVRLIRGLRDLRLGRAHEDFEPVFAAYERPRCEDFVPYLADDGVVDPAFEREVRESEARVARLRRSLLIGRKPPTEDEARAVVELRKSLRGRAAGRSGAFALRHFPQPATYKRARSHLCGPLGAIYGVHAEEKGGFVFAFSAETFRFYGIPPKTDVKKICADFAKVANDPKSTVEQYVAAATPLWIELVKPVADVFEQKRRVAVYLDPVFDEVPFEALVPPDAKGTFAGLPYLVHRIAVGRIPTASMSRDERLDVARFKWTRDPKFVGCFSKDAAELKLFTKPFGAKTVLQSAADRQGGAAFPPSGPNTILAAAAGFPQKFLDWNSRNAPDAAILLEPPQAPRDGMHPVRSFLGRGGKALFAPTDKLDPAFAEAMGAYVATLLAQTGQGPFECLAETQKAVLNGNLPSEKPLKEDFRHPAFWTKFRAYSTAP
jgi:hypothetical protein